MNKLDELKDLITALQKKEEEKQKNTVLLVLAVLGAVAAVAGIAYAVYRYFTPDYLDDFDDDLDDDFDNYFDDEDEEDKETEVPVEALVAKAVKHDTGVSHGGAENVPPCFLLKIKQMFHRNAGESRTEKYQPAMNQTKTDNIRSEDEKR